MREAFLDAGYLIALELRQDQDHAAALAHWREHVGSRQIGRTSQTQLATTTYIFVEALTDGKPMVDAYEAFPFQQAGAQQAAAEGAGSTPAPSSCVREARSLHLRR